MELTNALLLTQEQSPPYTCHCVTTKDLLITAMQP